MSTRITILLGAWFMVITASAQPGALWEREYDFGDVRRVEGHAVAHIRDGGYLVAGYHSDYESIRDILLLRLDSNGDTLWTNLVDLGVDEWVEAIVSTEDGGFVVCCNDDYNGESILLKIDSNGDTLWTCSLYDEPGIIRGPYFRSTDCMVATDHGSVVVCGYIERSDPPHGAWVEYPYIVELSADGSVMWESIYFDSDIFKLWSIDITSEGNYMVAGQLNYYIPRLVIAEIQTGGDIVWEQYPTHTLYEVSETVDILPLNNGYAICFAIDTTSILNMISVERYDSTGQSLWFNTADSIGTGNCELLNTDGGDIVLAGDRIQENDTRGCGLIAWNEVGEIQWKKAFGGERDEGFYDAILATDNSIVLTGYSTHPPFPINDWRVYALRTESLLNAPNEDRVFAKSFTLHPAYPNPFNPSTTIQFDLPRASPVSLTVYNLAGQTVETLVNGQMNSGTHTITFDGSRLSSGVYFYTLTAGSYTATNKMLLLK